MLATSALFSQIVAYYNYTLLTSVVMRDVMTDSHKPKKDEPKAVTLTVSKTADFKNRERTGITLAEYKELSAKDRASLTPREKSS